MPSPRHPGPITFTVPSFHEAVRFEDRPRGFSVQAEGRMLHFDRTGKLVRADLGQRKLRGRLAGRILENWIPADDVPPVAETKRLSPRQRRIVIQQAARITVDLYHTVTAGAATDLDSGSSALLADRLRRAVRHHPEQPEKGKRTFHRDPPPLTVMPPDQHMAIVLHATESREPALSAFTHEYAEQRIRPRRLPEFVEHIEQVKSRLGAAWPQKRSVLLAPADALGIRQPLLVRMLDAIGAAVNLTPPVLDRDGREFYPPHVPGAVHGIHCFADPAKALRKRSGDFRELVRRHLRRVYLPIDSGGDDLLAMAGSPVTAGQILQTALAAKRGGMRLGVIVALGVGGRRHNETHLRRTTLLLRLMELGAEDMLFFRPMVALPGTPYARHARQAGIQPMTDGELAAQRDAFVAALDLDNPHTAPATATYTLEKFLY